MTELIDSTPNQILILGGVFNIVFGFIMGHVLGLFRLRKPDSPYRYILSAHKAGLQQGFLLFGLVFAVLLSPLAEKTETIAAILLVSSTVLLNAAEVMNSLQGIEDEFKSRPVALHIKTISAVLSTAGIGILVYGVILFLI